MLSIFKDVTLFKDLIGREPLKCQTLIDAMKGSCEKYKVFKTSHEVKRSTLVKELLRVKKREFISIRGGTFT